MSCVNNTHLERLFSYFARPPGTQSRGDDEELLAIQAKCKELFEKDYNISIIPNGNGELCATYPLDLIILESCKSSAPSDNSPPKKVNDTTKLESLFMRGRFARVRARFPVPVILWGNKNICRSSTLSQKLEYMLQTAHNQVKNQLLYGNGGSTDQLTLSHMETLRNMDIGIIKQLSVKYILDLMMENKKKKFGFSVCSSEKVDMHDRYAPFAIASIPYPGVEFFQEFNQRKHVANDLHFDWNKLADYVQLKVDHISSNIAVPWSEYKTWDLVVLTQNYLKLMLQFISDGSPDSGLLVHCISGWDRTPLFISLLRISMWADGEIHQSLNVEELLYLTVAYDWLLFSHQLSDRASRGEDIFYYCFYFLQFITSSDFSVRPQQPQPPQSPPQPPKSPAQPPPKSPIPPPPESLVHSPAQPQPQLLTPQQQSKEQSHSPSQHHTQSQPSHSPSHIQPHPASYSTSNGHAKHSHSTGHSLSHGHHAYSHSYTPFPHHHTHASRSMPTHLSQYPARGGGDSTAPIDVPSRHHTRKVSDGCCESADCRCGSWQMMTGELSLSERFGSFHDPITATNISYSSSAEGAANTPNTDESLSDTSSNRDSRDFDHFDHSDTSTSWENEGIFPHEVSPRNTSAEGTSMEGGGEESGEGNTATTSDPVGGHVDDVDGVNGKDGGKDGNLDREKRRVLLLTQMGDISMAYYKQCCLPYQLQLQANNNNWMPQGIWRLLPRFV